MDRDQRDSTISPLSPPRLYCISDGTGWRGLDRLLAAAAAGADAIQVREKQLSTPELLQFCRHLRATLPACKLLINRRLDIALAAGFDGVHCPAQGLPPLRLRAALPPGFLIAQSCHSTEEVAVARGADFCVLGPIFATPSKAAFGPPLGLDPLRVAAALGRPVLALGGITAENAGACLAQGAAGIAAIRLFADLAAVARLRGTVNSASAYHQQREPI